MIFDSSVLTSTTQQVVYTITRDELQKINITVGVLLVIVILVLVIRYRRALRAKQKALYLTVSNTVSYRAAVQRTLDEEKSVNPSLETDGDSPKTGESTDSDASPDEKEEGDYRLYLRFNYKVMRDKLYLQPDITRDDLCKLMGVDKNRFGNIMRQYSGYSNCISYLNARRIEYAVRLLQEQPNYTMISIATECGFNNTVSFNRVFKDLCGMTPTEFKEQHKREKKAQRS